MRKLCNLASEMQAEKIKSGEEVTNGKLTNSQPHIIVEIVEYVPDSIVSRTVIKQSQGDVTATSFDEGEKFCEKTTEADTYVQIIDGKACVSINNVDHELSLGQGIVIPVDTVHCFKAEEKFKMITTIIKSVDKG